MRLTDMADELYTAATDLPRRSPRGHGKAGRRDGDAGGDRPGGPREAPGAVRHAGSPQRQCAGRAGRRGHRAGSGRAADASAAGGAGAGAGRGQPPSHRRRLGPRTAQEFCHDGRRPSAGEGHPPGGGGGPGRLGVHRSEPAAAGRCAGAGSAAHGLICVDSLCSSEPQRLGRTLQFSDTGLCPAQPGSSKHLDAARLGLPVIAAGIPTLMMAQEGKDLVVTPRELDSVIAHGGRPAGRGHQPRLAAEAQHRPALLAGGIKTRPSIILYG